MREKKKGREKLIGRRNRCSWIDRREGMGVGKKRKEKREIRRTREIFHKNIVSFNFLISDMSDSAI